MSTDRRRAGLAPTLALLVGVAVAATAAPLVSGASTDDGGGDPPPAPTTTTVAPSPEPVTAAPPAGPSVSPSFQQVAFTGWGDGSVEPARTLPATGDDAEVDLGVEVSYRVSVEADGDPDQRAVEDGAGGLTAEDLTYRAEVGGGPIAGPPITPTPEGVVEVG